MYVGTTGRVADLLLVVGTLAMGVGLSAVLAGLMPGSDGHGEATRERRPVVVVQVGTWRPAPIAAHDEPAGPATSPHERTKVAAMSAHVGTSATGPWVSPLYPQNGVTLWDRIRVSAQRDRRAFLLGSAIQLHAPQTAATPGPPPGSLRPGPDPLPGVSKTTQAVEKGKMLRAPVSSSGQGQW